MHSVWFGEFLGTLVLILLGNGVNAGVTLRKSYAADSGWIVITTGWGIAVLCGVLVAQACGSSFAHLNPAISFASAVRAGDFSQQLPQPLPAHASPPPASHSWRRSLRKPAPRNTARFANRERLRERR